MPIQADAAIRPKMRVRYIIMPRRWRAAIAAAGIAFFPLNLSFGQAPTESPSRMAEQSRACQFQDGNPDAVIEACTSLLEADVRESGRRLAVALTYRAMAFRAKGDLERAAGDLQEAISLNEDFSAARELYADILRENEKCDVALDHYDRAIKLTPDRALLYLNRGLCLAEQGEDARSNADFQEVVKRDVNNAAGYAALAWSVMARLSLANRDYDRAIANYGEAIKLDPRRAPLYIDRGAAWAAKGDYSRAHADYDQAIKLDQDGAGGFAVAALHAKALLYARQGEPKAVIAAYDRAIKLDPKRVVLFINRAAAFSGLGDFERALADYNQALELDPTSPVLYNARAELHRAKGEYARAAADYSTAIERNADYGQAYAGRGLTRFYLGEFARAAEDFQRVVSNQANPFSMLLLYISRSRSGAKTAWGELAKGAAGLESKDWPYPIIDLFLGRKQLQAVEAAAETPEQQCEARFYVGQWHLMRGARPAAAKSLQAAVDTCPKDFVEYRGAVEELKRFK
jgi:tetratricopeptide (TPR) repeat protein